MQHSSSPASIVEEVSNWLGGVEGGGKLKKLQNGVDRPWGNRKIGAAESKSPGRFTVISAFFPGEEKLV